MIHKTLKDHVYDYISKKINDGSLKPNKRINENIICNDLEISRTPVREALMQLASEGYLEKAPRKGFIVKELNLERVKNLYEIIGCLEALAASLSVDKLTNMDLKDMEDILKKADEAISGRDYSKYYKLQTEFHSIFIKSTDNKELILLLTTLKRNFIRQTYITDKEQVDTLLDVVKDTHSQHWEILKLFKEKDKAKLEDYLRNVHWNIKFAEYDTIT